MPGRLLNSASTPLNEMPVNRASGRVRKRPDVYASSPFASSAKRKRDEADAENVNAENADDQLDPAGDASDEETDEDEAEPDEEELREQKAKARKAKAAATKKPAQKKAKVNGATLPIRSATGGAKRRAPRKAKATSAQNAAAAGGLYAEVFASSATLDDTAGQWVARFEAHESAAVAEVVNFVLRCAGCEGEVTDLDIEDSDNLTSKLEDLRDEYQASNPTDYPLIAKGKGTAGFRQGMTGFFEALVKAAAVKGVLYDNPILMEFIQMWISTMSSAPNRSFRHTATVASLSIVTALCDVARENKDESAKFDRQAETEAKKARPNKSRVKQLKQNAKEKTRALETVEPQLKDWFDVVFVHRYRDVDPLIRRECVAALGGWIILCPDVFWDGQHLRYLGWVLSDTAASTRAEVVKQLQPMYKQSNMIGRLQAFTEKFRPRLVEIGTTDAEITVRIAGIELLDRLRELGLLEPDDIDALGRMIFDTELRVRKSIARFFAENVNDLYNSKVDELGGADTLQESLPEVSDDNFESPRLEWLRYKSLAEMLLSYDAEEEASSQLARGDSGEMLHLGAGETRFSLAAEVLYDRLEDVHDWKLLVGYLLFDHESGRANGIDNDALSQLKLETMLPEKEDTVLLEVLNASAKRNLLDLAEQLKAPKGKLTNRQREALEEEREELARALAAAIPRLLHKFGESPNTAAAVLRIEAILGHPDLRHLQQDTAAYASLLDDVRKQFMSHGTDAVLAPATSAILHAKSYDELEEITEEKVAALWDDVVSNLNELLDPKTITVRGASQLEELTALSNNLLRIVRLAEVSDCINALEDGRSATKNDATGAEYAGAIDCIIALINRAKPADGAPPVGAAEANLEDQIAARAANAALLYIMWKVKGIETAVTSSTGTGVDMDELEPLANRRDVFSDTMEAALDSRKPGESVCLTLANTILDLHKVAAILRDIKPRPGLSDDYTALVLNVPEEAQGLIMRVFAACERQLAKLSGRKLEAADEDVDAVDEDPMSDPEDDDDDDDDDAEQTQASQARRENEMLQTLLAEQKLCQLTGRIVHALFAEVLDETAVRKRLERNRARLGPMFKETLAYLDIDEMQKKTSKSKATSKTKGKGKAASGTAATARQKPDPQSNAIVADDEMDEDIEDDDGDEALKRRELLDEDEGEEAAHDAEAGVEGGGEQESVLGDD